MKSKNFNNEKLRKYLLDDVSVEEIQEIEEQFLADDNLYEELNAIEDELFYDYKQQRLNPRENFVFEKKFLQTSKDREKAEIAFAFLEASEEFIEVKKEKNEKISFWQSITSFFNSPKQFGLAAVSILIVASLGLIIFMNLNSGNEVVDLPDNSNENVNKNIIVKDEKIATENKDQQIEITKNNQENNPQRKELQEKKLPKSINTRIPKKEVAENKPKPKNKPSDKKQISFIALVLSPGNFSRSSGDGMKKVNLTPDIKNVRIHLLLTSEEDYKAYSASLKTINDGQEVWATPKLKIRGKGKNKVSTINISTKILQRTDYELSLNGINENGDTEEIDSYYFSVLKK
jgi:hypothetical protein